jgi:hypothetical protein
VSGTRDGIGRSVCQDFADVTEMQSDQRRGELGALESVLEAREEPFMSDSSDSISTWISAGRLGRITAIADCPGAS